MAVRRILTWSLLCAVASARASPRTDPTTGRAVFTGATMPHATSIGLDPAAIGLGAFDEIYVAFAGVADQVRIDLDNVDLDGTHTPGPRVRNVETTPAAMLAFLYHAGDAVTLGFEARTSPRESFPEAREALRYHTLGGGERDWLASVGASIKVTGDLFFGASLSHQNTFLQLRYARDTALANGNGPGGVTSDCGGAPCGIENPIATEIYDVHVRSPALSTSNLRVNVGGIYQLSRDTWLGVAYHTPPGFAVQTELSGKVDVAPAPRDCVGDPCRHIVGGSVVEIQLPASVDAELRVRLPAQLDLHIGGRWEDLSRFSAYDVRMFGSTLPRNSIPEWTLRPRGMHDAFAGWAGIEQVDTGKRPRTYGLRAGFETSSVTALRTSPLTIAPASFTLDAGAQWRTPYHLILQLSYGLQYFPTVNATDNAFDPRARIACIDSGNDYLTAACRSDRNGYAIPSAAGDYTRILHAVRFGVRYEFQ